ncbi:MAG: response regulator [SAR324 cluster bacterium]|nr:response regulator [SAR324 cluster bacterium]
MPIKFKQREPITLKNRILIAEDAQTNIDILLELLDVTYDVAVALNGSDAIDITETFQPNLILLDIEMPGLDGFEVCKKLKENKKTSHIPIIFLTAKSEQNSLVKGFNLGAADFVTKPFLPAELLARVKTHLDLNLALEKEKNYLAEIKEYNRFLSQRIEAQDKELNINYSQLTLLDKSKGEFLALISHELRTPMNGILAPISVLIPDDRDLTEDETWAKEIFESSYKRLLNVVDEASLLTEIELNNQLLTSNTFGLKDILDSFLEQNKELKCKITQSQEMTVVGSPDLFLRAITALVDTASKFSDDKKPVEIWAGFEGEQKVIHITSWGYPIPDDLLPNLFKIYSFANPITPKGDLGLKPPIADKIIRLFGGSITVENQKQKIEDSQEEGVIFRVLLE